MQLNNSVLDRISNILNGLEENGYIKSIIDDGI